MTLSALSVTDDGDISPAGGRELDQGNILGPSMDPPEPNLEDSRARLQSHTKTNDVPSKWLEGHGCPAQVPHGFSLKTYGGNIAKPWTAELRRGSGKEVIEPSVSREMDAETRRGQEVKRLDIEKLRDEINKFGMLAPGVVTADRE